MKEEKEENKTIELGGNVPNENININPPTNLNEPNIENNETEPKLEDNKREKKIKLPTINTQLYDSNEPKIEGLADILEGDDSLLGSFKNPYVNEVKKGKNLSKIVFLIKDIFFIFILLISSGLNFSYLYFPFFVVVFLLYFFLFQYDKNSKRYKRILEICSLIYAIGLLAFKLYFAIAVKLGKDFGDSRQTLIDLGILNLEDEDSIYYLIATFIGECFVIIAAIISIIISYKNIHLNFDLDEEEKNNNNNNELTLNKFYRVMSRCVYLFYICVVGWSIFNRSILTLIYLMPMNVILYFSAMNKKKNIVFYFFKFFSLILSIVIFVHLILINIFNIGFIRDHYITHGLEIRDNYPRVVNFWTKLGINQAFHVDMHANKLSSEYFGYFCGCLALLVLMYTNKQLTFNKFRKYLSLSKNDNEEIDIEDEYDYNVEAIELMNIWQKCVFYIKRFIYNPSFILHICRISAILWLYYYQNFYSIGVIVWLFFSFLYLRVNSNKIVTIVFLAPMVFVCLFCYHLANIDGFIENKENQKVYRNFALGKFSHKNVEYILCNIFYFLITIFIYTLFRQTRKKSFVIEEKEIISEKDKLKKGMVSKEINEDNIITDNNNIEDNSNEILISTNSNQENQENQENENEELDEFENKANEVDDFFKHEEKMVKEEGIDELYTNLTIGNIIIKAVFSNIDKITLVVLYFLAVYSINIVHFILVIIFMMQLLFPKLMINYSPIFIAFSQIVFLIEYCVDLSKNIDYSENTVNLIKLFIPFDLKEISIDFLLYLMTYCYYAQNQLFHSEFFNKIGCDENISLDIYIKVMFYKYPKLQGTLYTIGNVIKEIYAWVLIILFIIFNGLFEISIFFAINLLLFLCIMYNFLKNVKNQKKSEINLLLNRILLILCAIITISVYIFQIICLDIFNLNENFESSDNFFVKNLPALGFYRYFNNKLHVKFLPHFFCNLITKLFTSEMKNLVEQYEKKETMENIHIEEGFKKKKYELLIEYKKNLDKKIAEEKNKKNRKDSNLSDEIEISEEKEEEKVHERNIILDRKISQDIDSPLHRSESEDEESEKDKLKKQFDEINRKINMLQFKNALFNIVLTATKFYWLFLFLSICIIFTAYDLSILLIGYILIFGIIFMRMFYFIISRLSDFNNREIKKQQNNKNNNREEKVEKYNPFFISKLIRYNIIEKARHLNDNKKFRLLGFKYLIIFNFISYFLVYLDGVFGIFQGGCRSKIYDDCDKNHYRIVGQKGVFENISEEVIISIGYLFGFDVNLDNETVLFAGWVHIFLGALLCFDAYVQNIEDYFNELSRLNRREFRILLNENIELKRVIYEQQNILGNIQTNIQAIQEKGENELIIEKEKEKEEEIKPKKILRPKLKHIETIRIDINAKENEEAGKDIIKKFLKIFENAREKGDVKISSSNNTMKIIISIKKVFEEIMIFFLICTAVAKLNIWSIIYIIYSIYLILTPKTMKKYYILYCFLISSIILQVSIFVSNLQKGTDPNPDDDIKIMSNTFVLPWYEYFEIKEELAFFLGLGVCHSQINLIWMDFIEVVIIYIYLEYFSYSIYQEGKTIGKSESSINYFNLHLNGQVREATKKLSEEEYKKHVDCMAYNFGVVIDKDYQDFKYYIENGKAKNVEGEEKKEEEKKEEKKEEEDKSVPVWMRKAKAQKKKEKKDNKTNIANLKSKDMSGNKCMNVVKKFIYLSSHNLILILIITISMMISGFISIVYIVISLYFLLTSTKIYLGKHYYYPRAIKILFRVLILIDILLQIFYQIPFIDTRNESDTEKTESTFYKTLGYIGLNKILVFGKDSEGNFEVLIGGREMALVMTKVILYLFMSLQLLIYSSRNFIEYYLTYIITKDGIIRRVSLLNVFKFNNKRIEVMNRTVKLRQDMTEKMHQLEKTLERWNENIMKKKQELEELSEEEEEEINNEKNIDNEIIIEEEEEENKEIDSKKYGTMIGGFLPLLRAKKNKSDKITEINKDKDKDNEKKPSLKLALSKSTIQKDVNTLTNPNERPLTDVEVLDIIKGWILTGFLTKLYIKIHKYMANYDSISEKQKYIYEHDIIKGSSQIKTPIENLIEQELISVDLSDLTMSEMNELKQYFDGTRKKNWKN